MIYLVIICLCGVVYIAWRAERIEAPVREVMAKTEADEEAAKQKSPELNASLLPDDRTDSPWAFAKSREEERSPLENYYWPPLL